MRSFKRVGNRSMPETKCKRGPDQWEYVLCLIPELMISGEVTRELYTRPRARNNLGNRGCTGESCFDPVELWVMGPPCGLKVERSLASYMVMIARHVRG